MKPLDWAFLALSLSLTLGTAWWVLAPTDAPLRVEVQSPAGTDLYPLDEPRSLDVQGALGLTRVMITRNAVWVTESACTNKVCLAMGKIHQSGQFVACLPNRVFVKITGGAQQEVLDAGTY